MDVPENFFIQVLDFIENSILSDWLKNEKIGRVLLPSAVINIRFIVNSPI